jgi:hypothetical protein
MTVGRVLLGTVGLALLTLAGFEYHWATDASLSGDTVRFAVVLAAGGIAALTGAFLGDPHRIVRSALILLAVIVILITVWTVIYVFGQIE